MRLQLQVLIQSRRQVSLKDAALYFDVAPEAIRGMLEFWVSNGKISKYSNQTGCGGYSCRYQQDRELYVWNPRPSQVSIEIN